MKPWRLQRTARIFSGAVFAWLVMFVSPPAGAHEPFDVSSRLTVYADRMELVSTVGTDAMRELLAGAGVPAGEIAEALKARGPESPTHHSPAVAERFLHLIMSGEPWPAKSVTSRSEGAEVLLTLIFPRPGAGQLEARAVCYETIPALRKGVLVIDAEPEGELGAAMLSAGRIELTVTLAARQTGNAAAALRTGARERIEPPVRPSFGEYFKLGVHHILSGIDHLLFLAALILGVRRTGSMVGIVTCFTLAHSVTLALAALDVVNFSPRIVEPLIAASIVVVCVLNLVRPHAEEDRVWLAAGFGLIHGFGFAGALRETGLGQTGGSIVPPLLSFNLGVETGQLAVTSIFLPMLLLGRRRPGFVRYGLPAISTAVILVSSYWIVERSLF